MDAIFIVGQISKQDAHMMAAFCDMFSIQMVVPGKCETTVASEEAILDCFAHGSHLALVDTEEKCGAFGFGSLRKWLRRNRIPYICVAGNDDGESVSVYRYLPGGGGCARESGTTAAVGDGYGTAVCHDVAWIVGAVNCDGARTPSKCREALASSVRILYDIESCLLEEE